MPKLTPYCFLALAPVLEASASSRAAPEMKE